MNDGDVGVAKCGEGARLTPEALAVFCVEQMGTHKLDGDLAFQPSVARAKHLAHAALADRLQNLVGAQPSADPYGHVTPRGKWSRICDGRL